MSQTSNVKLTIARKGPLRVSDPDEEIELVWNDGEPVTPPNPKSFSLCRCGASTKKPFCDGSHSKIGFEAAEDAVPASAE